MPSVVVLVEGHVRRAEVVTGTPLPVALAA